MVEDFGSSSSEVVKIREAGGKMPVPGGAGSRRNPPQVFTNAFVTNQP
ncbi:hypothetical protein Q5689_04515 [Microcoleus sp. ARI1-A2]